jgi:hypothetical protein
MVATATDIRSPEAQVTQERISRIRAALAAANPRAYDPQIRPTMQFGRHHTDWGGFINDGEIAN